MIKKILKIKILMINPENEVLCCRYLYIFIYTCVIFIKKNAHLIVNNTVV